MRAFMNLVKVKIFLKDLKPGMFFPFPLSSLITDYGLVIKTKIIDDKFNENCELVEFQFLHERKIHLNRSTSDAIISVLSFE